MAAADPRGTCRCFCVVDWMKGFFGLLSLLIVFSCVSCHSGAKVESFAPAREQYFKLLGELTQKTAHARNLEDLRGILDGERLRFTKAVRDLKVFELSSQAQVGREGARSRLLLELDHFAQAQRDFRQKLSQAEQVEATEVFRSLAAQ